MIKLICSFYSFAFIFGGSPAFCASPCLNHVVKQGIIMTGRFIILHNKSYYQAYITLTLCLHTAECLLYISIILVIQLSRLKLLRAPTSKMLHACTRMVTQGGMSGGEIKCGGRVSFSLHITILRPTLDARDKCLLIYAQTCLL